MAFNTATGRAEYTATAGQTVFTFSFKIFNTSDVKVYQTLSGEVGDDTADLLIETTDYTVTINGDLGGDVTLTTGAGVGDSLTLVRDLPIDRETDYQQNGDLGADTLDADQDYQTYLIADAELKKDRSLQLPDTAQNVNNVLPAPAANHYIRWDASAQNFINDPLTALNPADYTKLLHTVGNGAGNPEGYTATEIDTAVANRRKQYAKETLPRNIVAGDVTTGKATITLTSDENLYGRYVITDSPTLTNQLNELVISATVRDLIVVNETLQDLKVWVGSGNFITVNPSTEKHLYSDGTNVSLFLEPVLLADFEVTGAAVTSVDFSGLDIASHKSYRVEIEAVGVNASTIYAFINGDTTITNYYSQTLNGAGSGVNAARANTSAIGQTAVSGNSSYSALVALVNGFARVESNGSVGDGVATIAHIFGMNKTATVANITQLTFTSSVAGSIGIGSKIRIYRGDI